MRLAWFFPLTYLAGIDGFGWFVPYLLFVSLAAAMLSYARQRRSVAASLPQSESRGWLELETAPA